MTETERSNQARETTEALINALSPTEPLRDRYQRLVTQGPAAGSRAADDLGHPMGELVWNQATAAFAVGSDHALAWYGLIGRAGRQPMRAHGSLLRGALEGAVTCRYLVDPHADQGERLRRAAALQLEDYRQRAEFERTIGADKKPRVAPAKHASERRAELLDEMDKHGVARIELASITTLCKKYAAGAWLYQLLSAFAHGKGWALIASELRDVVDTDVPGRRGATVTASDEETVATTGLTMKALADALSELEDYSGREA